MCQIFPHKGESYWYQTGTRLVGFLWDAKECRSMQRNAKQCWGANQWACLTVTFYCHLLPWSWPSPFTSHSLSPHFYTKGFEQNGFEVSSGLNCSLTLCHLNQSLCRLGWRLNLFPLLKYGEWCIISTVYGMSSLLWDSLWSYTRKRGFGDL